MLLRYEFVGGKDNPSECFVVVDSVAVDELLHAVAAKGEPFGFACACIAQYCRRLSFGSVDGNETAGGGCCAYNLAVDCYGSAVERGKTNFAASRFAGREQSVAVGGCRLRNHIAEERNADALDSFIGFYVEIDNFLVVDERHSNNDFRVVVFMAEHDAVWISIAACIATQ